MVVFPVLVLSVVQFLKMLGGSAWMPSRRQVLSTLVGVGLLFAGINLSPSVGRAYQEVFAHVLYPFLIVFTGAVDLPVISHTADPTDLIALPALYLAYRLAPRRR